MSNRHHHASSNFHNPHHQHRNRPSYDSDRRSPHPNHPPFPSDQDLSYMNPPFHRRRGNPRQRRDSAGYGGTHSSDVPERGTPVGPFDRDFSTHRRRSDNIPPSSRSYYSDNHRNEPRISDPSTSNPSPQNNNYRGGCPYVHASRIPERKPTSRNSNSQLHRPPPPQEEAREASSLRNRAPAPTSGPVKSMYNSRSPVKPVNNRSTPGDPYKSVTSSYGIEGKSPLPERTHAHLLQLEKNARPQNMLSARLSRLSGVSAPSGCPAIAPPATAPTADAQPSIQNQTEHQNGANSQSNEGCVETSERKEQEGAGHSCRASYHETQKRDSVDRIFGKRAPKPPPKPPPKRLPQVPDANSFEPTKSAKYQKDAPIFAQSKEEVEEVVKSPDAEKKHLTLPVLRSVPMPVRSSTVDDTPQQRAAAAAMHRARQTDCSDVKVVQRCQPSRSDPSQEDTASFQSEPENVTDDAEKKVKTVRQILATSASEPGPVDQRRGPSNLKIERKPQVESVENQRMSHRNQSKQTFVESEKQVSNSMKRRVTELDKSNKPTAKRPRPSASTEAVNLEDHVTPRRSQRFQQPKTNKKLEWELTKYEPERVQNLFRAQLRAQPMLLRISFLGISDGDLRATLDIFKNGMKLPEPDHRSLEINNNRIRCITNEICAGISALRVSSLNLSCNMLTTLGNKLGLCHELKFLNLSRNRLSRLPQELCDLTNLEVLNLSGNNIGRLPSGLCRLKKLEILSLSRNKLEVLPEDVAGEGAALTGLDISHNEGFRFFPRCTEHWTQLVVLHMPDTEMYRSLSRREHRLQPAALLKELAGRKPKHALSTKGCVAIS